MSLRRLFDELVLPTLQQLDDQSKNPSQTVVNDSKLESDESSVFSRGFVRWFYGHDRNKTADHIEKTFAYIQMILDAYRLNVLISGHVNHLHDSSAKIVKEILHVLNKFTKYEKTVGEGITNMTKLKTYMTDQKFCRRLERISQSWEEIVEQASALSTKYGDLQKKVHVHSELDCQTEWSDE
jgi:enamine deaminase RidA (YjgF/YER057c/UK114 family)